MVPLFLDEPNRAVRLKVNLSRGYYQLSTAATTQSTQIVSRHFLAQPKA